MAYIYIEKLNRLFKTGNSLLYLIEQQRLTNLVNLVTRPMKIHIKQTV